MLNTFVQWCVNNNLKFLVYVIWCIMLPCFFFAYFKQAAEDATYEFKEIKQMKKDDL